MDESWIVISHVGQAWPEEIHVIAHQAGYNTLTQCVIPDLWSRIQLEVILADDQYVQALNARYRGIDQPTNVLSFPLLSNEEITLLHHNPKDTALQSDITLKPNNSPLLLGDVYLAYETIVTQAIHSEQSLDIHLSHLVIHGILHLLGYTHDTDVQTTKMTDKEIEILTSLGYPNPYGHQDRNFSL